MSGRLISLENRDYMLEISGPVLDNLGLKMVLVCLICVLYLCVIAWYLNNIQIVVLSVWGRNGREFSVLRSGTECWNFWVVSDNPRTVWGLLKQSRLMVGLKLSMCVVCIILLKMNGL